VFTDSEIERALRVQARGWALVECLERSAMGDLIPARAVHEFGSTEEAAIKWIRLGYTGLPSILELADDEIEDTARYFATYLDTSFDFVEVPQTHRVPGACGCACGLCAVRVRGLHLRPKKLRGGEKAKARILLRETLDDVAKEHGREPLSDDEFIAIYTDAELRASAALLAYIRELFRRMKGYTEGPAVLALWRHFAWTPTGSPRRGFRLSLELVRAAEQSIATRLLRRNVS
jgi:hypothetical protein